MKEKEIVTLDGQLRKLNPEMLVIADEERAVGIAGVMGGLDTEVTASTKNYSFGICLFSWFRVSAEPLML